jgi:predicted transposase YdaD
MLAFSKEQIEWFRNESRLKYELDMRETVLEAQDEAREKGKEEGIAIGETRGIAIGEARTAEKNRKKDLRTAWNLRQMGLSDGQIASALGLRAKDLKGLESKKE